MQKLRFVWVLIVVWLASAVSPTKAAAGTIAFTSFHEGKTDIYVMQIGDTKLTNLTHSDGFTSSFPAWSPDGKRILFERQANLKPDPADSSNGHNQIYVMNADGSVQTNLTNDPNGDYYSPVWSPDGKKIAYVSNPAKSNTYNIYVMNIDGTDPKPLTNSDVNVYPSWSPNGEQIAFLSTQNNVANIYLIDANGTHVVQVTHNSDQNAVRNFPEWSPDGKRILFAGSENDNTDVFVINADGSNQIALTQSPEDEAFPHWSPDGSSILFQVNSRTQNGKAEIYLMNADGTNPVKVADGFGPAWVRE